MNEIFSPIRYCKNSEDFITLIKEWKEFGKKTAEDKIEGITRYTNEFWTSKQRQGHSIHEVSYRACFKPQLPNFFINTLTKEGDMVYDPFMGRGTTLIEAALLKRNAIGNDINPLSKALVKSRLNTPTLNEIQERLSIITFDYSLSINYKELLAFYDKKTLQEIEQLRLYFLDKSEENLDKIDRWIRMVAINRLTGHSKGFFSVYTLPPNQAVTAERQLKINKQRKQEPEYRDIKNLILRKSKSLLRSGGVEKPKKIGLYTSESYSTKEIDNESIHLTVTSPPFLDVVDYKADNWLRCWFLDIDSDKVNISQLKNIDEWSAFIEQTLHELDRITKKNGYLAFEVGEIRGNIELEKYVIQASKTTNFTPILVMINAQNFTKTSAAWGIDNNKKGTNTNRIVVFKKN